MKLPRKFKLLDKRGFEPMERNKESAPDPQPTLLYKLNMMSGQPHINFLLHI